MKKDAEMGKLIEVYEPIELEDYLYRIHFREDEIERVMEAQGRQIFDDLILDKQNAVEYARIYGGIGTKFRLE